MAGETILVIEDEEDILELLRYTLAREGFRVLTARDLPPNDGSIAAGQAFGASLDLHTVLPPGEAATPRASAISVSK